MSLVKYVLVVVLTVCGIQTRATTWDEPWMDKVITQSDCFVLARIKQSAAKEVTISIIKNLGGEKLAGEVKISSFYLLKLCSMSGGEGPEFHLNGIDSCYFFLKNNDNGTYDIATPTTGFAWVKDGKVGGTFRHSYHQARLASDVYEKTMTAIFSAYHNLPYDSAYVNNFVQKYLSMKPAGTSEMELETFFNQHVALECIYHLRLTGYADKLMPFINAKENFHAQVSAARALIAYNTPASKTALEGIITNKQVNDFVKVIAIWTLSSYHPVEMKSKLIQFAKTASTEENGFGGNIMDPRVCTTFPTVKAALDDLIKTI